MLSSILPSLRILRTLVRSSTATVTNVSSSSTPSPIFWMTRMPNHQSLFNSSSSSSSLLSSFWDKFLLPPFTTVPPQLRLGFELESVSSSNPSWLPKRANDDETNNHNPLDSSEEGNNTSTTTTKNSLIEALTTGIWFAVPKRKKSYARKRQRQMSHVYASHNLSHLYPCPKCDHGYLKVRHHMCPCDQEKVGVNGIIKVTYGNNSVGLPNAPSSSGTASSTTTTNPNDTGKA